MTPKLSRWLAWVARPRFASSRCCAIMRSMPRSSPSDRNRRTRIARTASLFLLLGALATILIAWAFALFGSLDFTRPAPAAGWQTGAIAWPHAIAADWPQHASMLQAWSGRGIRLDQAAAVGDDRKRYSLTCSCFGWPFLAVQYRWQSVADATGQQIGRTPSITVPQDVDTFLAQFATTFPAKRRLPLWIIPAGFAADTLLYAMTFWLLLRLHSTRRTLRRRHRHLCLACGYPIGASPLCTECGQPVDASARSTTLA